MNTDPHPASSVTDEEYQQALISWTDAARESHRITLELEKAEAREMDLYKRLKDIRATIARETLEAINGR